nr:serine/threonine-protein kinase GRIK2-like isoform X1 [Tanacetum cinerariifolium]
MLKENGSLRVLDPRDADTWAVGVTLYCMILGQYPFLGDTLQDTYDKIFNDPLRLPKGMNPLFKNLLEGYSNSLLPCFCHDCWLVLAYDANNSANVTFVLRPTEDVFPWLGSWLGYPS